MFFVGFWRFSYDRGGLNDFTFEPLAFFFGSRAADLYARGFAAEYLSRLVVVYDLEADKPIYYSLSDHQAACDDFRRSVVYSPSLDEDIPIGICCKEFGFLDQLREFLKMFHVEHYSTKM